MPRKTRKKPKIYFHGTDEERAVFNESKDGKGYHIGAGPVEFLGPSFSTSKTVALSYGCNVVERNLVIKNPKKFRKVPMRTIYTSNNGLLLKPKKGLRERRVLPKEKFPDIVWKDNRSTELKKLELKRNDLESSRIMEFSENRWDKIK